MREKPTNNDKEDEEVKKEEENKFKAFTGKGYMLEDTNKPQEINQDDDDMKKAMELSMNEFISYLEKQLPKEPEQEGAGSFNFKFRYQELSYSRRFNPTDSIRVILT